MIVCICVVCTGRGSVFGDSSKHKEDSAQFSGKCFVLGLLGDASPTYQSHPGLGHDILQGLIQW